MSVFGWLRRRVHDIALLRPLVRILGIKRGTVVDKATEAAEVVDKVLPPEKPAK